MILTASADANAMMPRVPRGRSPRCSGPWRHRARTGQSLRLQPPPQGSSVIGRERRTDQTSACCMICSRREAESPHTHDSQPASASPPYLLAPVLHRTAWGGANGCHVLPSKHCAGWSLAYAPSWASMHAYPGGMATTTTTTAPCPPSEGVRAPDRGPKLGVRGWFEGGGCAAAFGVRGWVGDARLGQECGIASLWARRAGGEA